MSHTDRLPLSAEQVQRPRPQAHLAQSTLGSRIDIVDKKFDSTLSALVASYFNLNTTNTNTVEVEFALACTNTDKGAPDYGHYHRVRSAHHKQTRAYLVRSSLFWDQPKTQQQQHPRLRISKVARSHPVAYASVVLSFIIGAATSLSEQNCETAAKYFLERREGSETQKVAGETTGKL